MVTPVEDSTEYYNFSYGSFLRIFNTLLLMITMNNLPDVALGDPDRKFIFIMFYVCVSLFNFIMASGIILAIINQKYHEIFKEEFTGFEGLNEYQFTLLE